MTWPPPPTCIAPTASPIRSDAVHLPFIATMWIPHIGGHYVAVLAVSANTVTVGDPLTGRCTWDRHEFEQDWKHAAHEFSRDPK